MDKNALDNSPFRVGEFRIFALCRAKSSARDFAQRRGASLGSGSHARRNFHHADEIPSANNRLTFRHFPIPARNGAKTPKTHASSSAKPFPLGFSNADFRTRRFDGDFRARFYFARLRRAVLFRV